MSCTTSRDYRSNPECGPEVHGKVKTIYVDKESYSKIGMIEATTVEGQPVIVDNSIPDIKKMVPKTIMTLVNPYPDPEIEKDSVQAAAREKQLTEMENSLGISAETKKLIAAEYMRLIRLHPKWKNSKAMRKAGEKYNVKFLLE